MIKGKVLQDEIITKPMPAVELMKKKAKKKPVEDMSQYDDTHYWTRNKK